MLQDFQVYDQKYLRIIEESDKNYRIYTNELCEKSI